MRVASVSPSTRRYSSTRRSAREPAPLRARTRLEVSRLEAEPNKADDTTRSKLSFALSIKDGLASTGRYAKRLPPHGALAVKDPSRGSAISWVTSLPPLCLERAKIPSIPRIFPEHIAPGIRGALFQ